MYPAEDARETAVNAQRLLQHSESTEEANIKVLRSPADPTSAELEAHNVCHLPFRAWCRACVAGRGRADHHRRLDTEDAGKATLACDYAFMGKRTEVEKADATTVPILVHRCSVDRWITAHPVKAKGPEQFAVEM